MDFENDSKALEDAILETNKRIKKLEEHKESVNKEIKKGKSDNTVIETLRRLERNLDNLYQRREFLIKQRVDRST